jgi:hypothetical protein
VRSELERVRTGERDSIENEHRMRRGDGMALDQCPRQGVLHDEDGRARKLFGIFIDISARREIEAARMELEQRLTKLVAQVPVLFINIVSVLMAAVIFLMPARILQRFTIRLPKKWQKVLSFFWHGYTRMICSNCVPPLMNLRLS